MCNGHRHQPGCDCGFGPPYPGNVSMVDETQWIEELAADPTALPRRLRPLGLERWDYERLRGEYERARTVPVGADVSLLDRIRHVFQGLSFETEEQQRIVVEVPLYRLHSPRVRGARVTYSEGRAVASGASWRVRVFGLGPGATRTVQVSYSKGFASAAGQCKEIFVPLELEFERIVVQERGHHLSRGMRVQVRTLDEPKALRTRGAKTYPPDQCQARHRPGECEADTFLLASDLSDEPSTGEHRWSSDVARDVGLQLSPFGIGVEALAQVRSTTHFLLVYTLPPGHDYVSLREPGAIYWQTDRVPAVTAAPV